MLDGSSLPALLAAGLLFAILALYAVSGGADFGAGVWDLLASGQRARDQRRLVEAVLQPVWEAHHVWLVFALVLLFAAFPPAFAALATALHIPLALALLAIVLRGASFTFRHYGPPDDAARRRWGRVFGVSSAIAPVMLGVCAGAASTGGIRVLDGIVASGYLNPWLGLFPFAVGLLALALVALLAAVRLAMAAGDGALREDFRRRAMAAAVAAAVLALAVLLLSRDAAPLLHSGLIRRPGSWALLAGTLAFAAGAFGSLRKRLYLLARVLASGEVTMVLLCWAHAQFPFLVPPDLSIADAAAPPAVLLPVLAASAAGALVLVPSFLYLYRVFRDRPV